MRKTQFLKCRRSQRRPQTPGKINHRRRRQKTTTAAHTRPCRSCCKLESSVLSRSLFLRHVNHHNRHARARNGRKSGSDDGRLVCQVEPMEPLCTPLCTPYGPPKDPLWTHLWTHYGPPMDPSTPRRQDNIAEKLRREQPARLRDKVHSGSTIGPLWVHFGPKAPGAAHNTTHSSTEHSAHTAHTEDTQHIHSTQSTHNTYSTLRTQQYTAHSTVNNTLSTHT
jgi:hypothetical protein